MDEDEDSDTNPYDAPNYTAEEYLDGHWQAAANGIHAGALDHCLDEALRVEREKHSPRTPIIEALETRKNDLSRP